MVEEKAPRLGPPQFDSNGVLLLDSGQQTAAANIINSIMKRCPWPNVEQEDLQQEAWTGFIDAAYRYKPESGTQFGTYAFHVIEGRMRDYVRKSGVVRKKRHGAIPQYDFLDASIAGMRNVSGGDTEMTLHDVLPSPEVSADKTVLQHEMTEIVWSTIASLPNTTRINPRDVMTYGMEHDFVPGWQREAGIYYGVDASRICQVFRISRASFQEALISQYSASDFDF